MEPVVLVKIKSLHVRSRQETGLKIRFGKSDILTGPVAACLDDSAATPANSGMIDLASRNDPATMGGDRHAPLHGRCLRQRRHCAQRQRSDTGDIGRKRADT